MRKNGKLIYNFQRSTKIVIESIKSEREEVIEMEMKWNENAMRKYLIKHLFLFFTRLPLPLFRLFNPKLVHCCGLWAPAVAVIVVKTIRYTRDTTQRCASSQSRTRTTSARMARSTGPECRYDGWPF